MGLVRSLAALGPFVMAAFTPVVILLLFMQTVRAHSWSGPPPGEEPPLGSDPAGSCAAAGAVPEKPVS